jgi:hypothetical protein
MMLDVSPTFLGMETVGQFCSVTPSKNINKYNMMEREQNTSLKVIGS